MAADDRVKIITKNQGVAAARNVVLDHAEGAYIGWMDSYNWIAPKAYVNLYDAAEAADADMVLCGYYEVHDHDMQAMQFAPRDTPMQLLDDLM